jgi:hypothetical protein
MGQAIQTLLGALLIMLVGLAVVSAVTILVLVEFGLIVRLGDRLYWRCRSFVQSLRESAKESEEPKHRHDEPSDRNRQSVGHPGSGRSRPGPAQVPGRTDAAAECHPKDERG